MVVAEDSREEAPEVDSDSILERKEIVNTI